MHRSVSTGNLRYRAYICSHRGMEEKACKGNCKHWIKKDHELGFTWGMLMLFHLLKMSLLHLCPRSIKSVSYGFKCHFLHGTFSCLPFLSISIIHSIYFTSYDNLPSVYYFMVIWLLYMYYLPNKPLYYL